MDIPNEPTPILTEGLLEDLLDRLRRIGAEHAVERFQPGVSDQEIDEELARVDLRASDELRVLWRWRNGQLGWYPDREARPPNFDIRYFRFMPLDEAVATYAEYVEVCRPFEPKYGWPRNLLPFLKSPSQDFAAAVDVPPGHPSPVHYTDMPTDAIDFPVEPSLGAVVCKWIEAIDTGQWSYDPATGEWDGPGIVLRPDGSQDHLL